MEATVAAQCVESVRHRVATVAVDTQNIAQEQDHLMHLIFSDYAKRLRRLAGFLKALQQDLEGHHNNYGPVEVDAREIEEELNAVEEIVSDYRDRCSLCLLLMCPFLLNEVQSSYRKFSSALDTLIPETFSLPFKPQVLQIQQLLEQAGPPLGIKQQAIVDTLDNQNLDTLLLDPALGNEFAQQIAEYLAVTLTSEDFKTEITNLKAEQEFAESSSHDQPSFRASYLKKCLQIFERAIATASSCQPLAEEKVDCDKPVANTSQHVFHQPFQSFKCPITREVMRDPVQIASGQTYERSAIEKWFLQHTTCPMGVELKDLNVHSNYALRQSIAEWRERNCARRLDLAKCVLVTNNIMMECSDEQVAETLKDVRALCEEDALNKYAIARKGLIGPLVHVLKSNDLELRKLACATLQILAADNVDNQELMEAAGVVALVVTCLGRCLHQQNIDEALQLVLLLEKLSSTPRIADVISHQDNAVLLIAMLLAYDLDALVSSASTILRNLPMNDYNIIVMAKVNMLTSLVTRLVTGPLASKISMAKALAELQMPEASKLEVSTSESIATLIDMMNSAQDDERNSAVDALRNLSEVASVCQMIAECNGLEVLVRLLTSRSSVDAKVFGANVIANMSVALGNDWPQHKDQNTEIGTLSSIILSNLQCMPAKVQEHLLQGLLRLAEGKETLEVAKLKMRAADAFTILIPLFKETTAENVRLAALQLFACLSKGSGAEAWAALNQKPLENFPLLLQMIKNSGFARKQAAVPAMTVLASLPKDNHDITSILVQANIIPVLVNYLGSPLTEGVAAAALRRFTSANNLDLQMKLAQLDVIEKFVNLLDTGSKTKTKVCAARALADFSTSTPKLVPPLQSPNSLLWRSCCSPKPEVCEVHGGICTVKSTFCLLEADAIRPLLDVLKGGEPRSSEAALIALNTLVSLGSGCHAIDKAKGVQLIIGVLNKGRPKAQDMAVEMLEKFFTLQKYLDSYGTSAQMGIIHVHQHSVNPNARRVAGKILRQLELLHTQSGTA